MQTWARLTYVKSSNYEIILLLFTRGVQLPVGGPGVQATVLLLPDHDLRAGLHARHRVLGQLLAGPQGGAGPRGAGRHHAAHHVHTGEGASAIELETEVHTMVRNHRLGPYQGFLLVESSWLA